MKGLTHAAAVVVLVHLLSFHVFLQRLFACIDIAHTTSQYYRVRK